MMMLKKTVKYLSGFTMIEILVAIAILAILVALAVPNYQVSVRKARRADAQADMMEFANTAERVFTQTNSYVSLDADTDGKPDEVIADTDYYTYTFSAGPTATDWTILASPKTGQADDPCGQMWLRRSGFREHKHPTKDALDCWGSKKAD